MLDAIIEQLTYHHDDPLIFSTSLFLFLFLGFSLVYFLLEKKTTWRLVFVTLFSYYFYYKSSGFYFFLLAVVTVSDFLLARGIYHYSQKKGLKCAPTKWLLLISLLVDLGLLGYFKYTNFFGQMIADCIGSNFQPWVSERF